MFESEMAEPGVPGVSLLVKFGLSEKDTKFEKIFLMVFTFTK